MRIGIGQINAHTGAVDANTRKILQWIDQARTAGCHVVVFPELALCGARPLDLVRNRGFLDACGDALQRLAAASHDIAVVVGAPGGMATREQKSRHILGRTPGVSQHVLTNRAYLFAEGKCLGEEDKQRLDTLGTPSEARYFTPGEGTHLHALHGRMWGILIGEDAWTEDGPMEELSSLGAEWVLVPCASPFFLGSEQANGAWFSRRAKENGVGLVCVCLVGGQDDVVYGGGSAVYDGTGRCIFQAPRFVEGLYVADLASVVEVSPRPMTPVEELRNALTLGIRDYAAKNGFSRILVGLSGGVDSAVVTALAVDAVGASNVRCVYLPSEFSSERSREDAQRTAQSLGVSFEEISIVQVHHALRSALPTSPEGLVDENLQPRVRGALLMALSNQGGDLVLCPGNKSEIAMGYNTLYGDTVGGLAPIADLYKDQVFALARAFGERIPESVLTKPPSAELRPDQRDEDDLPAYEVLDSLLREVIDKRAGCSELSDKGYDRTLVCDVLRRLRTSEYKRRQLPPGIQVSQTALGAGRIYPITNGYLEAADGPVATRPPAGPA